MRGDIAIVDADIGFGNGSGGDAFHPVILGCTVRISNDGFERIVRRAFALPIDLTHISLSLVSCGLTDGGAEVVARVRRGILDQLVTSRMTLAPAGDGRLRVTITYLRVGILAASWTLDYVLGAVNRLPGLRQSGPRSIDVDLVDLVHSRAVPVTVGAGVVAVTASASELVITMG